MTTFLSHVGDAAYFDFLYPYMIRAAKQGDFIPEIIAHCIDYYWWLILFQ